jgi:hypothetical protein
MLHLLRKQLEAFGLLARQDFVEEMIEHLRGFAPDHAKSLGTTALRQIVETGLDRARHYGFTQRGPVQFYIELMFHLGSDFDADPQYPWAGAVLNRPWSSGESQVRRASELFHFTNRCLDDIAGPGHRYAFGALRRALSVGLDFAPDPAGDVADQIHEHFRYLAPEKCDVVGREGLDLLVRHAMSEARARDAETPADHALIAVLTFGMGHACLTDPQFPWIGLTFEKRASLEQGAFQSLRRRSLIYLKHSLDNMMRRHDN